MNYRHKWHAGNFADVFKHLTLVALTEALQRKDTACLYLDTHAGTGAYDLNDPAAQTTGEYRGGIAKLLATDSPPPLVQKYLSLFPDNGDYPGSPCLLQALARAQDRLIFCELHPEDCLILKNRFRGDSQAAVHHTDGWQSLKAFLPPRENRGLVLIDPPYEQANEFQSLPERLNAALLRWPTGVYALWYPVKSSLPVSAMLRTVRQQISRPLLVTDLIAHPTPGFSGLMGCGMVIVNPPWQFEKILAELLPWLCKALGADHRFSITN